MVFHAVPGHAVRKDVGPARVCAAAQRLSRIDELSPREREVLRHAALGAADQEIATRMLVAHRTVRHYFTTLFQKLGARGRVDVALTGLLAHVACCEECLLAIRSFRALGSADRAADPDVNDGQL